MTHDLIKSGEPLPGFQYQAQVRDACRPFTLLNGNREAVMFIHGFTGSPEDFRIYATTFHDAGYDVFAPLVPGHGSDPRFLAPLNFAGLFEPFPALARRVTSAYKKVHVVGLSYGAMIATQLCFTPGNFCSLGLYAPAFYLNPVNERKMRWGVLLKAHRFRSTIKKPARDQKGEDTYAYPVYPLKPAFSLYRQSRALRRKMSNLSLPVYHLHGDADLTTPCELNHRFLKETLSDYTFAMVPGGLHVITLNPNHQALAQDHINWLKKRCGDD